MEKEYTYSAFISYSSKDEKVAKALWKKLEHYRLPSVLQKQYEDIPEKMHVFLDQGDIVPGDTVENALSRELADSRKLIVICSPNSAKSPYVELEVKNFLSLGHSPNDIIPYIIEGEVNRESLNNCYVPSLFGKTDKETINGVSLLRDGKWKAFVGVLANLLDVKFDEIYRREKVRRNRIIAGLCGLGVLFICSIGLLVWYITPHTKYYADYVTRWGIPEGIRELNKKNRKQYPYHYKITLKAFRPVKLMHVNVKGTPVPETDYDEHQNRPRIAEYTYAHPFKITKNKQKWNLSEALYYYDSNLSDDLYIPIYKMRLVYTELSPAESYVDFYFDSDDKKHKTLSNNILSSQNFYFSDVPELTSLQYKEKMSPEYIFFKNTSSIFRTKIKYDINGWDEKVEFFNKNNHIVHDTNGIKGYMLYHDSNGRIIKEHYLYDENNFYGFKNINTKLLEYDENDRLIRIGFYFINSQASNSDSNNFMLQKNEILTNNKSRNYAEKNIEWQNNNGELLQIITYLDEEHKFKIDDYKIEVLFDNNGMKLKTVQYSNKKTFSEEIVKNNKQGMPVETIETTSIDNEDSTYKKFYSYNFFNGGYILNKEDEMEVDGISFAKRTIEISRENNFIIFTSRSETNNGNIIECQKYDEYGRYIENKVSTFEEKYIWYAKVIYRGDNRSICYYKGNDYCNAPDDNYVRADFVYNYDGMLSFACFKDIDGNYVNCSLLGFATYSSLYSPNALLLYEEYVDADGYFMIPKDQDYSRYYAINDIDDKILVSGKWLDGEGNYANKYYNHFDSDMNDQGEFVVSCYDSNEFIVRELFYQDNTLQKISSCWNDYDKGEYNKVLYNYEGIAITAYTRNKEVEKYWNYENNILKNWTAEYADGSKEVFNYDENENPVNHIKYFPDGTIEQQSFAEFENKILRHFICYYSDESVEEEFYENGECVHLTVTLKDGTKEKEWFKEFKDGKLTYFLMNKSNGEKTEEFYENDQCIHHIDFKNDGTKENEWFKEFKDGKQAYFLMNKSNGEKTEEFYENGQCIHHIDFKNDGTKDNEWFKNYKDGKVIYDLVYSSDGTKAERWYENEKLVHRIVYNKNGSKTNEYFWEYKENILSYFKSLDSDGTILEEYYKNGKFYHSVKTYKDGKKEENYY